MSESHGEHGFAHVMSPASLLAVFAALIALTVLTVFVAGHPLIPKGYDVIIAMTIATMKGLLVVLFFMHLIHDKGLNAILFAFCMVFVALFLVFAVSDSDQYQHRIKDFQMDEPTTM